MFQIIVSVTVSGEFHIGTGEGIGRTVDTTVVRDEHGRPTIPGSTLKGLTRDRAEDLNARAPEKMKDRLGKALRGVFGEAGGSEGGFPFDAPLRLSSEERGGAVVRGRSARDPVTGTPDDKKLFRIEDASGGTFTATYRASRPLTLDEKLLVVASLRRIERLGGGRRHGKGEACVTLSITPPIVIDGTAIGALATGEGQDALVTALSRWLEGGLPCATDDTPAFASPPASQGTERVARAVYLLADAPLTLGVGLNGNILESEDYVSGTSWRGAIAAALKARGVPDDDPLFTEGMLGEELAFGPLYPMSHLASASLPFPAPRSLRTGKYRPGPIADRGAGVVDGLSGVDPVDHEPAVPVSGYLQVFERLRASAARLRASQRTEIDDGRQSAQDEALYSLEAVEAGQFFTGHLWGPEALVLRLEAILPELLVAGLPTRVGAAKTRGHGRTTISLRRPNAQDHVAYPGLLSAGRRLSVGETFRLTCHSDLIAIDELLRPVTRLDAARLWKLLGGEGDAPFEITAGHTATRTIRGFLGRPGLPRSADVALVAGSTWACHVVDGSRRQDLVSRLGAAEASGVGLRRGEGFGRVIVDHPALVGDQVGHTELPVGSWPPPSRPARPARAPRAPAIVTPSTRPEPRDQQAVARVLHTLAQDAEPATGLTTILEERSARRRQRRDETDKFLGDLHQPTAELLKEIAAKLAAVKGKR